MDVYVRPSVENAVRVIAALKEFGFGDVGLSLDDFTVPNQVVQLGHPPVRIDLVTSLSGVEWETCAAGAAAGAFGTIPVRFLGRLEFIANKRATGRTKDLADIDALGA